MATPTTAPATAPPRRVALTLRQLAARQGGIFTRQQALAAGWTSAKIDTAVRRSVWEACGYGAYCIVADSHPDYVYARRCRARLLRMTGDVVVTHESAATLLRMLHVDPPTRPVVTRARVGEIEHRSGVLTAAIPTEHRLWCFGLAITNGPRTLVDLLRNAADELSAQGFADGGLRSGITVASLEDVLTYCAGWPGIAQARAAVAFGEPLCETPLESHCRIWFRDGGLEAPTPQYKVRVGSAVKARADFCFETYRVVVEADGKVKYAPDAPWRTPNDEPLWEEKLREDLLRDLGFEVVRARWNDRLDHGADLVRRVRRAMERSATRR